MSMRMRWLGTACFEIKLPNEKTLVIDYYVDDSVSAPITSDEFEGSAIFSSTHGHYDHILETDRITRLIERIRAQGTTVCIIEHKMQMVMGLADRIVVLNYGKKIAEGSPDEIKTSRSVIEAYLGGDGDA